MLGMQPAVHVRRRVARPRDPAIQARNDEIYSRWHDGESVRELAERFNRKPVVIARIIARRHPEMKDATSRAMMRGRLEWLLSEMREVIASPGYKLSPKGFPAVDPDGEPALDMGARIEAAKVYLAVLDRAAKLDATDKPPPQPGPVPADVARQQMEESIAAIIAEKRRLEALAARAAVPGEVIRELPPAQAG